MDNALQMKIGNSFCYALNLEEFPNILNSVFEKSQQKMLNILWTQCYKLDCI